MDFTRNAQLNKLIFFIFLIPGALQAFPEMIRHGYVNCMACHTTHQGGDLLTPYGKELANELLNRQDSIFQSTSSDRHEWKVETPEWLSLGSHVRLLQTMSESSLASKAHFMVMQLDVDAAIKLPSSIMFYSAIGRYEPTAPESEWKDFIYWPRSWIQYTQDSSDSSESLALRVGRFFPVYGLNIPEHAYLNRSHLSFNPGQERLSAEISWNSVNYQGVLTGITQRASFQKYSSEKGYSLQLSKIFGSKARAGFNIYRTILKNNAESLPQKMEGVYALIGWDEQWSSLLQFDQRHLPDDKTGVISFIKIGYEYTKGIEVFGTHEYENTDTTKTDPHIEAYGLGVQYFPTSNIDLFFTFKKLKDSSQLNEYQNVIWMIAHLYF